jgi:hypothetical protein
MQLNELGDDGMGRVRSREEVEEIKIREKIKFSLVRQQINLNRELGRGGCPTARGKVYITSIFEKDGQLSVTRPQLCLECLIRQHLKQKDHRARRRVMFETKLPEPEIREFCNTKYYKEKCYAYRRFVEETSSLIVKRDSAPDQHPPEETETPGADTPQGTPKKKDAAPEPQPKP